MNVRDLLDSIPPQPEVGDLTLEATEHEQLLVEMFIQTTQIDPSYKDSLVSLLVLYREEIMATFNNSDQETTINGNLDHVQVLQVFQESEEGDWTKDPHTGILQFKQNASMQLIPREKQDKRHDLMYNNTLVAIVDINKPKASMVDQEIDGYTEVRPKSIVPPAPSVDVEVDE